MALSVLVYVEIGAVAYANATNWLFDITMPNYCVFGALFNLKLTHIYVKRCSQLAEAVDLTTLCELLDRNNETNPCCPGELPNVVDCCFTNIMYDFLWITLPKFA